MGLQTHRRNTGTEMMPPPRSRLHRSSMRPYSCPLCECTSAPSFPANRANRVGIWPPLTVGTNCRKPWGPCPYPQSLLVSTHPQAPLPQNAAGHGHRGQAHLGPVQYPCGKRAMKRRKPGKEDPTRRGRPTPHHTRPGQVTRMSTYVVPEETNFLRPSRVCWAK